MLGKLKNCIPLRSNIKIYVPSTVNIDQERDNTAFVDESLSVLSAYFGGATSYACFGTWLTKEGKLVKERVTICESFCTENQLEANIDSLHDFCMSLKTRLNQEAISLEVNGALHFI